jgi:hypothetical protein
VHRTPRVRISPINSMYLSSSGSSFSVHTWASSLAQSRLKRRSIGELSDCTSPGTAMEELYRVWHVTRYGT